MAAASDKRAVAGPIDSGGVYASRAASGGGYIFLAGTAIDDDGLLAGGATPGDPYGSSEAAKARYQARYMMERYQEVLPQLGSSLGDVVQLENYVSKKTHVDGYFKSALAKPFMELDRPTAATAQVGEFVPEGAVLAATGLAIAPDVGGGFVREFPGAEDPAKRASRQFNDMVAVGPYLFTTYFPTDMVTGIHPEVRTEDWNWRGSEIRSEAEYGVKFMTDKLATVGATLDDIVDYTLFLTDVGDLYEFDLAFGSALGEQKPSRTVIPAMGFAVPRREGAHGHAEGALRMEAQFRIARRDHGADKVVVDGPSDSIGAASPGVRVGPLLWLSAQYADRSCRTGPVAAELDDALDRLATICRNGGTSLANLLRLRAAVTSRETVGEVYAAIKRAIPTDPPAVSVVVVPSRLPATDARASLDGVAFVEGI